jgi:hypothetical protein
VLRHPKHPNVRPGHTPEVSDTVNEPVELSEEPWSDLKASMSRCNDAPRRWNLIRRVGDNQEPVQLGGRRLVKIQRYYALYRASSSDKESPFGALHQ